MALFLSTVILPIRRLNSIGEIALITSTPSKKVNLIYKGRELAWNGCLQSVKEFVLVDLNPRGKWLSPGGEVKLFKESEFPLNGMAKIKSLWLFKMTRSNV